ncbi:unnamed protein product [Effrenium voratum]|nr:unnamed protein product [Effrenium voratum]
MAFGHNAVWAVLLGFAAQPLALKVGINWQTGFESSWQRALPGETERYLIASFPKDFKISYARLPDPTWRPLIIRNLSNPSVLAVDEQNRRLFVADATASTVWWYQLRVSEPSKFLVTDGIQRVAATNIVAKGLAVSQARELYISGRAASAATPGLNAIYKVTVSDQQALQRLWTAGDGSWMPVMLPTGLPSMTEPMSPSTSEIFQPGPIAVDMFTLYWGNQIKGNASALASAPVAVPAPLPGANTPKLKAGAHALANNSLESVTGLAITSSGVFFAGRPTDGFPGIFAVPYKDSIAGCSEDDHCVRRVAQVANPLSLCWAFLSEIWPTFRTFWARAAARRMETRHSLWQTQDAQSFQCPLPQLRGTRWKRWQMRGASAPLPCLQCQARRRRSQQCHWW